MKDNLKITIRIADTMPMPLTIKREDEPVIREAEYTLNSLWRLWKKKYTDRKPDELLAMLAFQFAKTYVVLNHQMEDASALLDGFEQSLDEILLDVGGPADAPDGEPQALESLF